MSFAPLITPDFLREYTENEDIKQRTDIKLQVDIARAESQVYDICGHSFSSEKYSTIPENVKFATAILAEYYALTAVKTKRQGYKSESFDDYSYEIADSQVEMPNVESLLKPYIESERGETRIKFSLRTI